MFKVGQRVRFKLAFREGSGVQKERLAEYRGEVEAIDFDNLDVVHVKWDAPGANKPGLGVHHYALEEDPDEQA